MLESIVVKAAIFIGMIFAGDAVSIPLLYLAFLGKYSILLIAGFMILSGLATDPFWYYFGRKIPEERIKQFSVFKKRPQSFDNFSEFFKEHSLKVVFFSKFAYGFRNPTKLLCGVYRIPFMAFWCVSFLGVLTWTLLLIALGTFFSSSLQKFELFISHIEIGAALAILCVLLLQLVIQKYLKKATESQI